MKNTTISPHNFLKSRRPDEFSDSAIVQQAKLDKAFFDYYLDTLTNRNEEKKFELFCKRMAEYEICPNLLPQTGPTGGGDSKVDSETYPVSDDISLTWYSGIGREAASERWAFAISAKKDWKTKVKSDVANIISTDRDYKTVFFFSNQYIPDKKRAATEDELHSEYNIAVKILDRSWLLDKLFNNHREEIAAAVFGLSDSFSKEQSVGPLDYERKQNLDALESEITKLTADGVHKSILVEKYIQAALLSRELELPIGDTMGRFNRASTLAQQYGAIVQQKDCAYEWAWTLYWWYEEFDEFYTKYCDFEKLVVGSINAYDLERLTNLWMNLYTVTNGNPEEKNVGLHTETLVSEYNRIIGDTSRPNTSLEARANFVFVKLRLGHDIDALLEELREIIGECGGVLDFSLNTISKMIMEIAPALQDSPNFDRLFETIVSVSSNREQEKTAAELLLNRGKQLLDSKPYSAIRYLGRALLKLYKEECKPQLLLALCLLGYASERMGLLWAARGYYVNAFYIALIGYMKFGRLNPLLAGCSSSIRMIELRRGRVPHLLEWHRFYNIVKGLLYSVGYDIEKLNKLEKEEMFDGILGILFLKTPYDDLHRLVSLPDVLEKYELYMAAAALKYSLGYIDEELLKVHKGDQNQIDEFMRAWYNQPASDQIPDKPSLGFDDIEVLWSKVLGCQIRIEADRKFPCVQLAESILAALESFLATGILENMITITPNFYIEIRYSQSEQFVTSIRQERENKKLIITCSDYPQDNFVKAQSDVKKLIWESVAEVIAQIVLFHDAHKQLEALKTDDLIYERSLLFTGSVFNIADLFGKNVLSINNLFTSDEKNYPFKRATPPKFEPISGPTKKHAEYKLTRKKPEEFDPEAVSHKDIEVISIINVRLWDKAKWRGMMFALIPDGPIILSPIFSDKAAAVTIFKEWISLVGKVDNEDIIQVGLIKGINKKKPYNYMATFTANVNVLFKGSESGIITMATRHHRMEPENDTNLTNFEKALKYTQNHYLLVPSYIDKTTNEPDLIQDCAILKKHIEIKNAWEIGEDSWLSFAITPEDDPIIPPFVAKAPVDELMKRKKNNRE